MEDSNALLDSMQSAVRLAIGQEKKNRIVLPKSVSSITRDNLADPRPVQVWGRTKDFLELLDAEVRKSPAEGVSTARACELMKQLGGTLQESALRILISRTMPIHSLTIWKRRVRLSTREVLDRIERERVA